MLEIRLHHIEYFVLWALTDIFLEKDNWFCTIFEKKPSYLSRNFLFVYIIVTRLGEMTLPEESVNWISQEVVECRFQIFWEGHKKLKKCSNLLPSHFKTRWEIYVPYKCLFFLSNDMGIFLNVYWLKRVLI